MSTILLRCTKSFRNCSKSTCIFMGARWRHRSYADKTKPSNAGATHSAQAYSATSRSSLAESGDVTKSGPPIEICDHIAHLEGTQQHGPSGPIRTPSRGSSMIECSRSLPAVSLTWRQGGRLIRSTHGAARIRESQTSTAAALRFHQQLRLADPRPRHPAIVEAVTAQLPHGTARTIKAARALTGPLATSVPS